MPRIVKVPQDVQLVDLVTGLPGEKFPFKRWALQTFLNDPRVYLKGVVVLTRWVSLVKLFQACMPGEEISIADEDFVLVHEFLSNPIEQVATFPGLVAVQILCFPRAILDAKVADLPSRAESAVLATSAPGC